MNGSGKTTLAFYLLSISKLDRLWVAFDFKREELFGKLAKMSGAARIVDPRWRPRRGDRGLVIVRPRPQLDDAAIEQILWDLHKSKEKPGLYLDEAYLIPKNSAALQAILTQGRSKGIQCITLIQRPAWVSRFVMSEANNFGIFFLIHSDDRKIVTEFVPLPRNYENPEAQHFYWYHAGDRSAKYVLPVAHPDIILTAIARGLPPPQW